MADHYVRHLLFAGGTVRTRFECRAPEGARCRTWCDTCDKQQLEQCECLGHDREPNLVSHDQCNLVLFLEEDPEYCYGGDDAPVRGPDWQPICVDWMPNDDGYEWSYEEVQS